MTYLSEGDLVRDDPWQEWVRRRNEEQMWKRLREARQQRQEPAPIVEVRAVNVRAGEGWNYRMEVRRQGSSVWEPVGLLWENDKKELVADAPEWWMGCVG